MEFQSATHNGSALPHESNGLLSVDFFCQVSTERTAKKHSKPTGAGSQLVQPFRPSQVNVTRLVETHTDEKEEYK